MNKYFQLLVKNVRKQLESWLNEKEIIQHIKKYIDFCIQ